MTYFGRDTYQSFLKHIKTVLLDILMKKDNLGSRIMNPADKVYNMFYEIKNKHTHAEAIALFHSTEFTRRKLKRTTTSCACGCTFRVGMGLKCGFCNLKD